MEMLTLYQKGVIIGLAIGVPMGIFMMAIVMNLWMDKSNKN